MIDTHCHLADKRFDKDRDAAIDRALGAGVTHFVEIAYAPAIVPRAHEIARRRPYVFLCLGVHPSESGKVPAEYLSELRDHARHARVVAIGETGLDFIETTRHARIKNAGSARRSRSRTSSACRW